MPNRTLQYICLEGLWFLPCLWRSTQLFPILSMIAATPVVFLTVHQLFPVSFLILVAFPLVIFLDNILGTAQYLIFFCCYGFTCWCCFVCTVLLLLLFPVVLLLLLLMLLLSTYSFLLDSNFDVFVLTKFKGNPTQTITEQSSQ
jgi:hypothetical protein